MASLAVEEIRDGNQVINQLSREVSQSQSSSVVDVTEAHVLPSVRHLRGDSTPIPRHLMDLICCPILLETDHDDETRLTAHSIISSPLSPRHHGPLQPRCAKRPKTRISTAPCETDTRSSSLVRCHRHHPSQHTTRPSAHAASAKTGRETSKEEKSAFPAIEHHIRGGQAAMGILQ